jgi:hypothetical protein
VVGPRPAHRTEHVAPHDPRADVVEAFLGEAIVDAALAAVLAQHRVEHPRREQATP